ncbi:FxSxx-COOH system tetratricopeptide repeat protein [Streptomyces globisporus]|uniref:FxSxx-COOH system tetratricopeptide repeat protein n=1 Tax=Streptomyces TaxID=1883 RepID=UPI000BF0F3C4|nr:MULTISPECIES: FxSxx-COOH system tetratricopeptide repeat protein [Streptomyces]PPA41134.1 ATP-binding protein [Streptomyces griseus]RAN18473.1 ATP-binding protein [Streptomyces badius]AWL87288.1 TIR domain-containing protein [Streptomyces globisporus]RAN26364.1 ATP-binding protein [Streptomyces badius]GGW07928.1 ATP-binding protein [Streptomyces globisporus]
MTTTSQRFFISYAGLDRPWAEWVGWHLERADHQVILDVWDWSTGGNFVERMDEALKQADAVVALFSKSYFDADRWTQEEWTAAVARRERIIPLALEPLAAADTPHLLAPRLHKNLHGLDETAALAALREAINGGTRPTSPPIFPGKAPAAGPTEAEGRTKPRLPGSTGQPDVWNVRRRNPDFAGREAVMVQLRESLLNGQQAVVQALHGMGGIGKTQIALEYAHRFSGQYDLVWWIDAEQSDQVPVHYTELADHLGIAKPDAGSDPNARAVLHHLRTRQRWLIVLDNAEDPAQIAPWLPEGPGHVLITSRNHNWRGIAHPTGLDVFTRSDSLAYLGTRIPGTTAAQADALAQDLGDLPLALAQAAGVIGSGMTLDRYRQLLTGNTARILQEGDAPGYPAPLAATVGIATTRLDDNHPEATALLRLGAFLGPDPIPIAWLESARPHLSTIPGDPDDLMWLHTSLQHLGRYGLARIDHETFQIHRLTQAVLRDQSDSAQTERVRDDVTTILRTIEPGDPESPDNWAAWASLTSHLTAQHVLVAGRPELRPTLQQAAIFLIRSGQPRTAVELLTSLRETWTADLGPDNLEVLTCAQYLGHATFDFGDFTNARPIIEDTLTRRSRTLGDDHPDTLHSANDLATVLNEFGEHTEARRMHEDTLTRRRRTLGVDHPDTFRSATNLAMALGKLDKPAEALPMLEDTLVRARRILGDDHPDTLHTATNVAAILNELGKPAEAHRMLEDTLVRARRTLGDDHPDTLHTATTFAGSLSQLGKKAECRRTLEDTLARRRRTLGDDHPDTLHSAVNFAVNLLELGEHAEARPRLEDTLLRARRTLGDDHPDTLKFANALATALNGFGEHTEARRIHEDTLAGRRRILGNDHRRTLQSAYAVAITLYSLRAYSEAAELLEDVRARQRRTLGDHHRDTLRTTHALADTLTAMGKRFAAQKLLAGKKPKRRLGRKRR